MSRIQSGNIPKPANPIQQERAHNTSFSTDAMFQFLEGNSASLAAETLSICRTLERDLVLRNDPAYLEKFAKPDVRRSTFHKVSQIALLAETFHRDQMTKKDVDIHNMDVSYFNNLLSLYGTYDPQVCTRLGVNLGLFLNTVKATGTREQYEYWALERKAAFVRNIYGCFAMTEMAHGSNVAGLETTAKYIPSKKSFVINTPHLGATKWWIGGAAHTATHCVAFARLLVPTSKSSSEWEDYGVKTFIVPLRAEKTHMLLPGVSIGDIGAKMGRDGIDNGWIQFSNVEIPKHFMLQRYCKINDDSDDDEIDVVDSPMDQLAYAALLWGRVSMVSDSFRTGAKVVTIASRYAVGRRQFGKDKDSSALEKQLIDYPSHQNRILPLLATVYCLSSGSLKLTNALLDCVSNLDKLLASPNAVAELMDPNNSAITDLKAVFVASASMKPFATWFTARAIDECRQTLGGHGYSAYAGFGKIYDDWVVQCTWEGDNTVLSINAGKGIVKYRSTLRKSSSTIAKTGKTIDEFLFLAGEPIIFNDIELTLLQNDKILQVFDSLIIRLCDSLLQQIKKNGGDFDIVGPKLVRLSKLFASRYNLNATLSTLKTVKDFSVISMVNSVIATFGIHTLHSNADLILELGIFQNTTEVLSTMEHLMYEKLYPVLRHEIIGLTDSFKFMTDFFINSPLGCYNGDFYEKYFEQINSVNNCGVDYDVCDYQEDILNILNRPEVADLQSQTLKH